MPMRVVIKDLNKPSTEQEGVVVGKDLNERDAKALQKRFTKLKWDLRRPNVYTIDNIALLLELE